jgi:hypothetical protein
VRDRSRIEKYLPHRLDEFNATDRQRMEALLGSVSHQVVRAAPTLVLLVAPAQRASGRLHQAR